MPNCNVTTHTSIEVFKDGIILGTFPSQLFKYYDANNLVLYSTNATDADIGQYDFNVIKTVNNSSPVMTLTPIKFTVDIISCPLIISTIADNLKN